MPATWVPLILLVQTVSVTPPIDGGVFANVVTASVRPFSSGGRDYVLLEAPRYEVLVRPWKAPLYLTVPVVLSWGVKGGFTSELSVGFGLSWSPSRYVSVSAQQRLGTFFFNHGARERTAGLDITIPIARKTFVEGMTRQSAYVVIGAEYFHRDVDEWAGFMTGEHWYASGHGVAIRLGIRSLAWGY
jgi:hypothetical protein